MRPMQQRVYLVLMLMLASKLAFIAVPWALKRIIDLFSHSLQLSLLAIWMLLSYALLRFVGGALGELRDLVFARVTLRLVADFTLLVYAQLLALDARFHLQRQTGGLSRDVDRGTTAIAYLLGVALMTVLPTLIEISVVALIMALAYPTPFTLIILFTFIAYGLVTLVLTERRVSLTRQRNACDSLVYTRLVDSLVNYETIKAQANERFESGRLQDVLGQRLAIGLATQRALSTLHIAQSAVIALGVAATMLLAGQRVAAGSLSIGDLVLINAYLIQICLPLNTLGFVLREARDALINTERLFDLLRLPTHADAPDAAALQVHRGEVRFEHVDFGYEAARPVLRDLSFTIPPGGTVAVVGGSGSGKSTVARLLLRYYEPWQGCIRIDGQDIATITQSSLRQQIGLVPQDTVLFNDSIAYNIAYAHPDAGQDEIIAAAQAAHVHEFVSALPDQYQTTVGERGLKLSGGEKQRIAIARAFLKNPPLLILDEATSALDTRSEKAIQVELERISRERSVLVIAHRLSTVVDADEILVLERGTVVERGRHETLLARQGVYAQMWSLQQKQTELERLGQRAAMQPINLAAMLAGLVDTLRGELELRDITLYSNLDAESARITGDPSALQQMLWELMIQVADACTPGGRLELSLQRHDADARIQIGGEAGAHDMSSKLPRLSTTPVDTLQLKSVVEANRGHFELQTAQSQQPRYLIDIPLRAVTNTRATPPPALGSALQQVRVLVIDDQREAREMLLAVFGSYGAQAEACASGREALKLLQERSAEQWPRLLICDVSLGNDEDGYRVLRMIRELEARQQRPLRERLAAIALTGHVGSEARVQALLAGFQMHLAKPVEPKELLAAAASLLYGRVAPV